jgi:ubiquinone/menaquinone biosynthesis C-methylase UbiE
MVAITDTKKDSIFRAVSHMYSEVASCPSRIFHFPTGRTACEFVGYPAARLDAIPATAVESFAGVGYPFMVDAIREGDTVLDIGSGSGTDALIASLLVGTGGRVVGLDMTPAMLGKARANAAKMGANNAEFVEGNAETIPLPDASVEVVTSNGVLNLVPDKARCFGEIFRVLKPGGRIQISDIVLGRPIKESSRENPQLWAECIVGAVLEDAYLGLFRNAGFVDVAAIHHVDYFSKSAEPDTREVAEQYGAITVILKGCKPR